jgi:chaperonin GroEL
VALIRCIPALEKLKLSGDEQIGVDIIKRSLEEPARQIASNAGQEGSIVVQRIKEEKTNVGFDADKLEYTDMVTAGIIDPTKVVRTALQNAASISSLLITTEALITDLPEKDKDKMPAGGHGGPGGGFGGEY